VRSGADGTGSVRCKLRRRRGRERKPLTTLIYFRTRISKLCDQGTYAEAVLIAKRYVVSARQKHGDNHTECATAIASLVNVCYAPSAKLLWSRNGPDNAHLMDQSCLLWPGADVGPLFCGRASIRLLEMQHHAFGTTILPSAFGRRDDLRRQAVLTG